VLTHVTVVSADRNSKQTTGSTFRSNLSRVMGEQFLVNNI